MPMTHQTHEKENQTADMGFTISDVMPKALVTTEPSELRRERNAKGIDLTMVSLVAGMIAIQLTLLIALITPKGQVAQQMVADAVLEQPVAQSPKAATLELPASPTFDKRFMNGLEVAPAPADADPFVSTGIKRK